MRRWISGTACLLGVVLTLGADDATPAEAKKKAIDEALKDFVGTWDMVSIKPEGSTGPARRVTFRKDGSYTTFDKDGKELWSGTYDLDPTARPKIWDHRTPASQKEGKEALGIYELSGDQLKVAIVVGQWKGKEWVGKPRPTEFSLTKSGAVIELKRVRPDEPGQRK